jgi:polyisoprenoid-binding protein YceI
MSTTTNTRQAVPVGTWQLDPIHSTIGFEVDYLAGSFRGQFREVAGNLQTSGETPVLTGSAKVASVDVKDENLAGHLQSPDFFDAERYPELSFESAEFERTGDEITVRGGITIKGVEKPVELTGTIAASPRGKEALVSSFDGRASSASQLERPSPQGADLATRSALGRCARQEAST